MGKKQGDQNIGKIAQILETVAQTVAGPKYIHFKAQFENPAYLHQTTLKPQNTSNKTSFETAFIIGENSKNA